MQKILSIYFLIHYTLANDLGLLMRPRDQEDTLANKPVESFLIDDSEFTDPSQGNQLISTFSDASSETGPGSQEPILIKDVESLFVAGSPGPHCTSNNADTPPDQVLPPSRFQRRSSSSPSSRRAEFSRREESKTFCTNPEAPHQLENTDRSKPQFKPDPSNRDRAPPIVNQMIMLVKM